MLNEKDSTCSSLRNKKVTHNVNEPASGLKQRHSFIIDEAEVERIERRDESLQKEFFKYLQSLESVF